MNLEQEKKEQKSMMFALILVIGVLFVFNRFFAPKEPISVPAEVAVAETVTEPMQESVVEQKAEKKAGVMIPLRNDFVQGSFDTAGTKISSLSLLKYRETTEKDSPFVSLLNEGFGTQLYWTGISGLFPDMTSGPIVEGDELTPFSPVKLVWETKDVVVERVISMDDAYLITMADTIINRGEKPVSAVLNGKIIRQADTVTSNRSSVHQGFLGYFDNREVEEDYDDITAEEGFETDNTGGWVGITDKYWQTVFVPDQTQKSRMAFDRKGDDYIASFTTNSETIPVGDKITRTTRLFAGAKELSLINAYEKAGIPRFDLSIDFGWYYFLTKPFLYFLGFLYSLVGNMGVAILIFATLLRIALLPIATKSYESMAKMKKIQPKIKALQERYKDNKQQLQLEMMALYKRDKVNPASGCLPLLIQIPVFFALYKVLSVSILMRQAPFFGWITDLSVPDPSSVFTAFGYLPWPIPSFLNIGVWPLLMGLTMVLQQRLNPSPTADENQKIMMNIMPIVFMFMLGNFASGLVIYWTWSNILSIAQQKYVMKKVGV